MPATLPHLKPQAIAILRHLETGQAITDAQARDLYGCTRLGARVLELKQAGYPVVSELISVATRHGKARVARYTLTFTDAPGA